MLSTTFPNGFCRLRPLRCGYGSPGDRRADTDGGVGRTRRLRPHRTRAAALRLELAVTWAGMHPGIADQPYDAVTDSLVDETTGVAVAAIAEFAAVHGISTNAGRQLIADAVALHDRLPRCWQHMNALQLPAWKATARPSRPQPRRCRGRLARQPGGGVGRQARGADHPTVGVAGASPVRTRLVDRPEPAPLGPDQSRHRRQRRCGLARWPARHPGCPRSGCGVAVDRGRPVRRRGRCRPGRPPGAGVGSDGPPDARATRSANRRCGVGRRWDRSGRVRTTGSARPDQPECRPGRASGPYG